MMSSGHVAVTCVYVIMTSLAAGVQVVAGAPDLASFDQFVRQLMECRRVPGLVLSVVDMSRDPGARSAAEPGVVVQRQYGWADIAARRPMSVNTRVCIASLTKAFTATLLGIMLHRRNSTTEKSLSVWDTRLSQLLPVDMASFDDDWVTSHVTVRDVILHRTGVSRNYDELWLMKAYDRQDIVRIIKHMDASANFRSQSHYNNVIYSLAGHVIERLGGGRSWESLLRELVLDPLNMTHSWFYDSPDNPDRLAQPYLHPNGVTSAWTQPPSLPRGISSVSSSVSLCSTSRDMSRWMAALLHAVSHPPRPTGARCHHHHQQQQQQRRPSSSSCPVLPPSVVHDTFQPHVVASHMIQSRIRRPYTDVPFHIDSYGLGWFIGRYRGWKTVLHYGSLIGAYSLITLLPEQHIGIFSSYNGAVQSDPYTLNSLLHIHLIDLFLGLQPSVDNATYWCSHPDLTLSRRSNMPVSSVDEGHETSRTSLLYPPSAYIGVYWHDVLGQFEVFEDGGDGTGELMARYGTLETRLQPRVLHSTDRPAVSGLVFTGVPTDPAWLMLLGSVYVQFEALEDADQRQCRRVSVDLLKLTTFERRHGSRTAAVSGVPSTVIASLAMSRISALASVIIILMMTNR